MNRRGMSLFLAASLVLFLVSGCAPIKGAAPGVKNDHQVEAVAVKVYFGAHDAEHLVAEIHSLRNDALLLQRAMEALAAGPRNKELWPVIPPAAKVKSVVVKDRTATVDFSDEMVRQALGGSSREVLAVAAIVNTLTEFPDVERVQILVEGKKVETLFGHVDVSGPLSRSPGIIKEK